MVDIIDDKNDLFSSKNNLSLNKEDIFNVLKKDPNILSLSEYLWLKETDRMKNLRKNICEFMNDDQNFILLLQEYEDIAMDIVEKYKWDEYSKWQIALILLKALIAYDWGNIEYYRENVKEASDYAYNAYYDDIDEMIQIIKKSKPIK